MHAIVQGIERKRVRDLNEEELTILREEVDKYTIEGDLRRFNSLNIKRLRDIGCHRGRRHTEVCLVVACFETWWSFGHQSIVVTTHTCLSCCSLLSDSMFTWACKHLNTSHIEDDANVTLFCAEYRVSKCC